ncbi:MAG TPA: hypothetical protein DIS62_06415, partial [Candidatus Kerfeldbacteria bacterium]|nr:hypothetical protein [Candidatus Kerfeldbacteria bacterium]
KKKDPAEWQADQFAAMLLMPSSMVRASISTIQEHGLFPIKDLEKNRLNVAENYNLRTVARQIIQFGFSNVSIESMCYRLVDLDLVIDSKVQQGSLY